MRFYYYVADTHSGCCRQMLSTIRSSFASITATLFEFSLQQISVSPNKSKSRGESPPQSNNVFNCNFSPSMLKTNTAFSPRIDTYRVFPPCESLIAAAVEFFFCKAGLRCFAKQAFSRRTKKRQQMARVRLPRTRYDRFRKKQDAAPRIRRELYYAIPRSNFCRIRKPYPSPNHNTVRFFYRA